MANQRSRSDPLPGDRKPGGGLTLSQERRAQLEPMVQLLLADLAKLEELEQPELEPVTVFWPRGTAGNGGR